ncbi:hypothetical protein JCM3765_003821 [Sporobolomyces pararoseus]
MPSLHVPNELLDQIFDLIHDKSAEPTRELASLALAATRLGTSERFSLRINPVCVAESQQTFASLARTSKLFLPLARSYLYHRPIFPSSSVSWNKAISLVNSISSPLGQLVVSLDGIADFVLALETLHRPIVDLPFKLQGYSAVFSFYYKVFEGSPHLSSVEIIADSMRHLNKLLKALTRQQPTLKAVKFGNRAQDSHHISEQRVLRALQSKQLQTIENLVLENVDQGQPQYIFEGPSIPLSVKSFSLISSIRDMFLSRLTALFPKDPSSLRQISIEIDDPSLDCHKWILRCVPPTLTDISFTGLEEAEYGYFRPELEDYLESELPSLSGLTFRRFSSLATLSLHNFHGPSINLLKSLTTSSPLLSHLDFSKCRWESSSPGPITISNDTIYGIVDPDELKAALLKMGNLKKIHLGVLPTELRGTHESLEELKEKKGIDVEWDIWDS